MNKPHIVKGSLLEACEVHIALEVSYTRPNFRYPSTWLSNRPAILINEGDLCLVLARNLTNDENESFAAAYHQKSGLKFMARLTYFVEANSGV